MNTGSFSVKHLCIGIAAGMLLTMTMCTAALYTLTGDNYILYFGLLLTACAELWLFLLIHFFGKRLSDFTSVFCRRLDNMMSGNAEPISFDDSETLFARINHRIFRLYGIMQENRRRVDAEREELQALITDISHQVKMPVSNLKMVTDTLMTKKMPPEKQQEFLHEINEQTDKLNFLVQAMVKSSRLETGAIRLEKKEGRLYDTLAQAMSGIISAAEKKQINVSVSCPEHLKLCHDTKWTAEALFNILDNGVKYTPQGGSVDVTVREWEMYIKVDVADNGRGISESRQASIFKRFYRDEEVHEEAGIGIGLYLAREIITRQGGYIKVKSEPGKGSVFSVFLPKE